MNKDQFLKRLSELLDRLSPEERRDAIRYYVEYFDEAGPENETRILLELGSPEEAAAAILADYGYDTPGAESAESTAKPSAAKAVRGAGQKAGGCLKKIFSLFKRAFLFCLKLALGCFAAFCAVMAGGFVFFCLAFLLAAGICGFLFSVAGFMAGVVLLFTDLATGLVGVGAAFVLGALSFMVAMLGWKLLLLAGRGCKKLYRKLKTYVRKRKEAHHAKDAEN